MSERKFLFLRVRDIFLSFLAVAVSVLPVHAETLELGRVSKSTSAEPVSEPQVANPPVVKPVAPEEVKADSTVNKSSYRLRARDFIRVGVINENDTVIERRINPDGTVDIPFLKQLVPVAGLTITEAQVLLTKRFSRYFKQPQVVIAIVGYAERRVYISGFVGRAGPVTIPPEENLTLGKALSMAGGIQARGRRSDVAIKRLKPDGEMEVILKDMRKIDSGDEPDFILQDEDAIYVEDSRF